MPRGKRSGTEVRRQCREAVKSLDRMLDHLMAADIRAKGGRIDGHGKFIPAGVDLENPEKEGHPVLNQWLPLILPVASGLRDSLVRMIAKM